MMVDLVGPSRQTLHSETFDNRGDGLGGQFRNRTAVFVWGFAGVFAAAVAVVTGLYLLKNAQSTENGEIARTLLVIFWLGCFVFARFACRQSVTEVRVEPGGLRIDWIFPFARRSRAVPHADVAAVGVVDSFDSEGHPYYYARLRITDGTAVDFSESHSESACRAEVERLKRCLTQR